MLPGCFTLSSDRECQITAIPAVRGAVVRVSAALNMSMTIARAELKIKFSQFTNDQIIFLAPALI